MFRKIISLAIVTCLSIVNTNYVYAGIVDTHDDIRGAYTGETAEVLESIEAESFNKLAEFEDYAIDTEILNSSELENILTEKAYITEDEQSVFQYAENFKEGIISEIMTDTISSNNISQEEIEETRMLISTQFFERVLQRRNTSLEAKDIMVEIADTYILCIFEENMYRYAYMYLDNGRINKSVVYAVGEYLHRASNINNESITYYNDTHDNHNIEINPADREEFMKDLQKGLVPKKEVYTLEDISEYIKNKYSNSSNSMENSLMFSSTQSAKRVYRAGPIKESQFKYVMPSINSPSKTVNILIPNTKQYTKNPSDSYVLNMYDFYVDYVEQNRDIKFYDIGTSIADIAASAMNMPSYISALLTASGVVFDAVIGTLAEPIYFVENADFLVSQYRQAIVWDYSYTNGYISQGWLYRWIPVIEGAHSQDPNGEYIEPKWVQMTMADTLFECGGIKYGHDKMELFASWTLDSYINDCRSYNYWIWGANEKSIAPTINKGLILPEHQHTVNQSSEYILENSTDSYHYRKCTNNICIFQEKHDFSSIPATCNRPSQCTCSRYNPNGVKNALNHSWGGWTTVTAATCTAGGSEKRTCTLNNSHTETRATAPNSSNHSWGVWTTVTTATCTTGGSEKRTCSRNSSHIETRTTATNSNHSWGGWTTVATATCTAGGVEKRTCSRNSGHTEMRSTGTIPSNHSWGGWTTASTATCTAGGSEKRTCSRNSGHTETRATAINSSNHSWGGWTTVKAATCTASGTKQQLCTRNPSHKNVSTISATGHSISTRDGGHVGKLHYYVDKCSKCSYSSTWSRSCNGNCALPMSLPIGINE